MEHITYFDMYLNIRGYTGKFVGLSNINKDGGRTCRIDPSETCTEEELQEMYSLRDSYNWDQPNFWIPKVKDFKEKVFTLLPDVGKLEMAPILMAMDNTFIDNPENMQIYWAAFLANRPAWMTNEIATQIDQLAATYNIPIEVGQKPTWLDKAKSFFKLS